VNFLKRCKELVYYEGGPFPQFAVISMDSVWSAGCTLDLIKHSEFMQKECVSFAGEDNHMQKILR
jgi:hypothetical protein